MSRLGQVGARIYRGEISFDFVGRQRLWYLISGVVLLVSIAGLLFNGLNLGVEFKGGSVFQFRAPHATESQVRSAVQGSAGVEESVAQRTSSGEWRVQTESLPSNRVYQVQKTVAQDFDLKNPDAVNPQIIGPSWGKEISAKALQGLGIFLVLVAVYLAIAFEWKMSVSALVALLHDIVITVGLYALIGIEVTPASVIGLLTILGYSLYDTVVVFDKVRENTAGILSGGRTTYSASANLAVNQTLVRSINTSIMALLPVAAILVVSILFLGGGTLEDLALVLFVGMIAGTYSSIFIATPLLADFKEREPQYRALTKRVATRAASPKRARRQGSATGEAEGSATDAADQEDEPEAEEGTEDTDAEAGTGSGTAKPKVGASSGSPPRRAPQGPRQQPRRNSRRRPGGGKKRR